MTTDLRQGIGVPVPNRILTIRLQGGPADAQPSLLNALGQSEGGREHDLAVVMRQPAMLVLSVEQPTLIRVQPPAGSEVFAPHSVFTLVLGPEGADSERVVLRSVDVSGLRKRDLVTLIPAVDEVIVTAVAQAEESPLPPLAARARIAAREVLATPSVGADYAVSLQVAVDGSASLRTHIRTGELEKVLEIVMGLSQVICSAPLMTAHVCGQSLTRLPQQRLDGFARPLADATTTIPPTIGFRSDLIPDVGSRTLTFVVTDALPADLTSGRSDALHLIVLSGAGSEVVEPRPTDVGATVLPPPGRDWDPSQADMNAVVASLLVTYHQRFGERDE